MNMDDAPPFWVANLDWMEADDTMTLVFQGDEQGQVVVHLKQRMAEMLQMAVGEFLDR